MLKRIFEELRHHAPFTIFGAFTGIIIMIFFKRLPANISYKIFYTLHPLHVMLSALVTASMYGFYRYADGRHRWNFGILLIIGYVGSVGIATISDSLIPYLGESLLGMPNRGIHIGFIEEWWLVNPLAVIGIAIAALRPATKFPHAAHVLLSTWASLFHIMMSLGGRLSWFLYMAIFFFLFIAVWIPCCISDIVFPLLLVRDVSERSRSHDQERQTETWE
ncbi:MAG: hypothetical protein A2Z72_08025 [Omnitrophica bacterium RBG_13_46_9]|nr:MAG: hypothetical protein A2Z72_08025 [Omnitrophica bacterium RBG_13_46_9]